MPPSASIDVDLFDHDAVRALLVRMDRELAKQQAAITAHEKKLTSCDLEIAHLRLQIENMRHERYGASSEKLDRHIDQLTLKLEELESEEAAEEIVSSKPEPAAKNKPARRSLPEHLHRDVVTHAPEESCCPDCGRELRKLGEDVSEHLEHVPETFKVIRHVRIKMCCTGCDRIVQTSMPSRPIERCLAGPALLAHVLTAKYANHIPLNRQSEIYAREGVELDRSTLAGWVGAASRLLAPLVDSLRKHVMVAGKIHADDTPVPVLAPGRGRTKTGRLWTYVRDDRPAGSEDPPAVWFAYSPDRKGMHPQQHLKDFRGVLQADAYAGCGHLYNTGGILEAACMAHARRKFHDIHAVHPSAITTEALSMTSKPECEGSQPINAERSGNNAPVLCSKPSTDGSNKSSPHSPPSPIR